MSLATWFFVPVAYLLGSIPFSVFLVRWATGRDVTNAGSGNPGATNALRLAGPRVGLLTLLCDVSKGIAPVAVARLLGVGSLGLGSLAVAVVIGHVYSVFLGFRGGKGVATAAGALGALEPGMVIPTLVVFVLVIAASRYVSLGSVAASICFPISWIALSRIGWLEVPPREFLVSASVVALLIVFKHTKNFVRLKDRTERRLGELRKDGDDVLMEGRSGE